MIEPRTFRDTLGRFATGITVVTMMHEEGPRGITVNSFLSLSLVPPLVGVSIGCAARAHETLRTVSRFGVTVLSAEQGRTSDLFAGRPVLHEPSFDELGGVPVVAGGIARLACRVMDGVRTGDHTLFVGRVEACEVAEGRPLVFYRGRYERG